MTEPIPQTTDPSSSGSIFGAVLLAFLGVLFLLSTGCFEIVGIAFLADGQKAALFLVLIGIGMGFLTYITFRGAGRLYRGAAPETESVSTDARADERREETPGEPKDD